MLEESVANEDPLYMTEAQIAAKVGLSAPTWRKTANLLEREGFPRRDPLFGHKRHWPACRAFLDGRIGFSADSGGPDDSAAAAMDNWTK